MGLAKEQDQSLIALPHLNKKRQITLAPEKVVLGGERTIDNIGVTQR
jgi:hypothetical protein